MTTRARDVVLIVGAVATLAVGVGFAAGLFGAGTSDLREAAALMAAERPGESNSAASHRFDRAEKMVADYLRAHPDDSRAHWLMVRCALDRPRSKPVLALEHLPCVRSDNTPWRAQVKLYQGKADYRLDRFDEAEKAWLDALDLDPKVPEAGWALMDLYYLEGREGDAQRMALRLHESEPDPRDRVLYLLELARWEAQPAAPASIAERFRAAVAERPEEVHAPVAAGLALIRDSQADRGLEVLERVVRRHPDSATAWDGLLTGLGEAPGASGRIEETLRRLPPEAAKSSVFHKHKGRAAQERRDWNTAEAEYREALAFEPFRRDVFYRLLQATGRAGHRDEAARLDARFKAFDSASTAVRDLHETIQSLPDLGHAPHPDLFGRMARLREAMGRPGEARAWHRLVLQDDPGNETSRAALTRLSGEGAP